MERPLVKHGGSTLMISLPKKWLDKQKLSKGDKIHIIDYSDKLVLSVKEREKDFLETTVHFKKADYEQVRAVLGTLHRKGYKKIFVKYEDPKTIYFIQLITKAIFGFEIIKQEENGCIIKNIIEELSIDADEILNKVINIIKTEFIIVREYLEKGIKGKDNEIRTIRDDCWKFRNITYINLKETLLASAFDQYFLIHMVEYNSSFLYWLYRSFDNSDIKKVDKDLIKIYDLITDYFNQSISKMKKKDKEYIDYIMINREKLLKECEAYSSGNNEDRFLAIYLGMLVQNIHNPKSLIV